MKPILGAVLIISLFLSCKSESEGIEQKESLMPMQFSPALKSSYKSYLNKLSLPANIDSVGYGMFIESLGPDSSVYYFHVFQSLEEISFRSMIIGIGYVDTIPVVVSMRSNELAGNYEKTNRTYLKFIEQEIPLKAKSSLLDIYNNKCVYYKGDSVSNTLSMSSPVVPRAK